MHLLVTVVFALCAIFASASVVGRESNAQRSVFSTSRTVPCSSMTFFQRFARGLPPLSPKFGRILPGFVQPRDDPTPVYGQYELSFSPPLLQGAHPDLTPGAERHKPSSTPVTYEPFSAFFFWPMSNLYRLYAVIPGKSWSTPMTTVISVMSKIGLHSLTCMQTILMTIRSSSCSVAMGLISEFPARIYMSPSPPQGQVHSIF